MLEVRVYFSSAQHVILCEKVPTILWGVAHTIYDLNNKHSNIE